MTSIPAPYAVDADVSAQRWWDGLSEHSRDALTCSWKDDDRADPLQRIARRAAQYLNDWLIECERPRDPTARELWRRGLATHATEAEPAGWDWGTQDRYEYRVAHADLLGVNLHRACYWESALPETRMNRQPTCTDTLASGSWWAL